LDAKKAIIVFASLFTMFTLLFVMVPPALAHLGTPIDSGWAALPPVINGNMAAEEWSAATVRNFTLEMRSRSDGTLNRTLNARLYVMNNWTQLFLAVRIFNDDYEAQDAGGRYNGLFVLFDDNHDGVLSVGDNGEGVTTWKFSPFYSANDLYYAGGGFWDSDVDAGMTNDGALAWNHTNKVQGAIGNWTFEMMIPLVGTDGPLYDFKITTLPQTVGFKIWFQEPKKGLDGVYPDDPAITKNIDEISNGATFGDLTIHPLYTLTIITTTGGTTNPAPGQHQYPYNTVVSVTATANPEYVFHHWELDTVNVGSVNPYLVTMNQNHTLKAVFWPLYTLTITTNTGGTTNPAPGSHKYLNGTVVSVTAIPDPSYILHHWELDTVNVGSVNPYLVTMNQNHTLKAVFYEPLSVTIAPLSASVYVGQPVIFTSIISGGVPPYGYKWFLNGNPVSSATTWTFTPTSPGIYYVYLNITDGYSNIKQSATAKVMVTTPPTVGGYSVSLSKQMPAIQVSGYTAIIILFGAVLSLIKRKRR
jgi:hypothetical protein